ncbi:capping protein, Arp2/3 and myosin-I linker protein 3-like isoform X4 [Phyllopteryx taeniolatus]|uniref:capping protein, Arp2/3 and myosin-I linker protein 3-like isoform X4 n=1 Tax=Phyllopteryx taeniolatus TaxID=161469 RepID=UPI002AD53869|nr:capping protein, Arp2/3 and myosin-I linker protein 3-like isoform X4 [Phyllopteryx taeniolatus]
MAAKEITVFGFASVNKDITDSIRKIIEKSSIKFICGIKLDTKSGKTEDRILVLATWRLYFLAPKIPAKIESTFNFLEIRALNSHPDHQVIIDSDKSTCCLRFESRGHLNHVVSHINYSLSRIFNNSVFAPSICHSDSDLSEGSRKYSPSSETSVETQRACGGFSETYAALCDYNGISCKEEVQWDVDTIYHSQDNREFNLLDFSHLESRDLAVIVASVAYNTWFTKLYCKDLRLGSEVTEQVLHTVSKSSSLEEITLENAGLKSDFPHKMAAALSENPAAVIHSLNLAHNSLDNQGVANLIQQMCRLSKGLRLLNLSKTSLTSKGVVSLSMALNSSDEYSNSLLHLDLSKNPGVLSGDDASSLYLFLSQPNCLVHLDLSGTDCSVDSLFGALLRGCCADLAFLNLSKNSFSHRKGKDTVPLFRRFFSAAFSLTHVSLAAMKLPPDVLRALLAGLTSNPHINDLHLDISGCELRCAGAAVLQELFPRVSSIATLDISDNGLDADLLTALPALSRHPSLKHLHLGKNFNIKNRVLDEVLQKLVQLIQEEDCALQSLSLTDSRLRSRGTVLVNALGSNTCLRKVDLSGNNMDDIGAKMLSKALQINTTLRSVTWDRNNTSAAGFLDVARALEHNFTLQYMPLPLSDISQAYRGAPERTEQALTKIQRALVRNNQTQRFSQRQALRLHQGLVTSTAEQVMERLCARVQQQVCQLRGVGEADDIQAAKQVLKEARNSRALYPSLCELAHVLSVDGPVRQRLDSLAGELAKAADKELQAIVDSMVSLCRELCPLSSAAAERLATPLSSVSERVSVPRAAIRSALMERAAQDVHRALEEVKLSVVSYLTNSIVDQILQELYATHKTLTHQVSHLKRWDGSCEDGTGWRFNRHRDSLDITEEELGTSIDTIAIKKRSSRTRRIRPVSTRLSLCDDCSSSPPPSVPSYSTPLSRSASWEGLSELPTQGLPLRHVTRVRPRPPRRHKGGYLPAETSTLFSAQHTLTVEEEEEERARYLRFPQKPQPNVVQPGVGRRLFRRSHRCYGTHRRSEKDAAPERPPKEADKYWADDKQRTSEVLQAEDMWMPGEGHTERWRSDERPGEALTADRQWTVERHTQWQIDRKMERQRLGGRQIDRSWSEGKQTDAQLDARWTDRSAWKADRQVQALHFAQRPLPPYPSDKTPSPKQEASTEAEAQGERRVSPDACVEGRRSGYAGRPVPYVAKPEPPPQSSKPNLSKLRQRHRLESSDTLPEEDDDGERDPAGMDKMEAQPPPIPEKPKTTSYVTFPKDPAPERILPPPPSPPPPVSRPARGLPDRAASQGEEGSRPQAPVKPQRNRKAVSCDAGTDRDSPTSIEKPPNRKPPEKKPRLPQNRNKSLDLSDSFNAGPGHSELV